MYDTDSRQPHRSSCYYKANSACGLWSLVCCSEVMNVSCFEMLRRRLKTERWVNGKYCVRTGSRRRGQTLQFCLWTANWWPVVNWWPVLSIVEQLLQLCQRSAESVAGQHRLTAPPAPRPLQRLITMATSAAATTPQNRNNVSKVSLSLCRARPSTA